MSLSEPATDQSPTVYKDGSDPGYRRASSGRKSRR
jgi:hypothetical protein